MCKWLNNQFLVCTRILEKWIKTHYNNSNNNNDKHIKIIHWSYGTPFCITLRNQIWFGLRTPPKVKHQQMNKTHTISTLNWHKISIVLVKRLGKGCCHYASVWNLAFFCIHSFPEHYFSFPSVHCDASKR